VAFTLLEIVEQQARWNEIDAALDTMSRIADASDWAAAMEVIAISQFKAGDQRGALHTAKLIPYEINRNCVWMYIGFEQARSGNVHGAIETAKHIEAPLRKNAVLLGIALLRANAGDIPGALTTAGNIESELSRARAYREIEAVKKRK